MSGEVKELEEIDPNETIFDVIDVDEVAELLKVDEYTRSFDDYYLYVDLLDKRMKPYEEKRMTNLLEKDPTNINIACKLGIVRRKSTKQKDKCPKTVLREAIALDPHHIQILYNTAVLQLDIVNKKVREKKEEEENDETRNLEETLHILDTKYPTNPYTKFLYIYRLGHSRSHERESLQLLEKNLHYIKKSRTAYRYSMILRCDMYKKMGNSTRRFECLEELFEEFPTQPWGLNEIGFHFIRKSKDSEYLDVAEKWFLRSGKLYPRSSGWCYGLARVYHWLKDTNMEFEYYGKELERDPECKKSLVKRTEIYTDRKQYDLAMKDIEKLIDIDSSVQNYIKKAKIILSKDGVMKSISYLEDICVSKFKEDPSVCEIYCELARNYGICENYEEGQNCVNRAIAANPDFLYSYLMRAGCSANVGKLKESVEDYDHVLNHENVKYDDMEDVYYWKGMVLARSKYHLGHILYEDASEEENLEGIRCLKKVLEMENYEGRRGRHFESMCSIADCYRRLKNKIGCSYRMYKQAIHEFESQEESLKKKDPDVYKQYYLEMSKKCVQRIEKMEKKYDTAELLRDRGFEQSLVDMEERLAFLERDENDVITVQAGVDHENVVMNRIYLIDSHNCLRKKCLSYYKFFEVLGICF